MFKFERTFQRFRNAPASCTLHIDTEEGIFGGESLGRTVPHLPIAKVAPASQGDGSRPNTAHRHGGPQQVPLLVGIQNGPLGV